MHKVTLYKMFNLALALIYAAALIVQRFYPIFQLAVADIWFGLLLTFIGISMILRAILFKSDSATWLSISLTLLGIVAVAYRAFELNYALVALLLFIPIALASLVTGLIFKEIYHIRITLWIILIGVPVFLYLFKTISLWAMLPLLIGTVGLGVVVSKFMPAIWRRVKN